jgi:hypothetical protein
LSLVAFERITTYVDAVSSSEKQAAFRAHSPQSLENKRRKCEWPILPAAAAERTIFGDITPRRVLAYAELEQISDWPAELTKEQLCAVNGVGNDTAIFARHRGTTNCKTH